jgi:hypothetical protein
MRVSVSSWSGNPVEDKDGTLYRADEVDALLARQPKAEQQTNVQAQLLTRHAIWLESLGWDLQAAAIRGVAAHLARQAQAEPAADIDLAAKLNAAVDAEYPLPGIENVPDRLRAIDNRAAMWRGINAARKILAAPVAPAGAQNAEAIRNHALEEAAKACESEVVNDSGLLEQENHNYAVNQCAKLIRALKTGSANTQDGGA